MNCLGRPYTEEERGKIKIEIKKVASKMFMNQGFKNFRIQQLTKEVGISLGGFYTFYKDKESLYREILRDEKNRIRKKIIMIIKEENQIPKDFFKDLSNVLLDKTATNKFYTNEYSSLLEALIWNDDPITAQDNLYFMQQIKKVWTDKGINISVSAEKLVSAVAMMTVLCTNKNKIGVEFDSWYHVIEKLILDNL